MIGPGMTFMAAKPGPKINLSGVAPWGNQSTDFDISPGSATAGWYFRADGSVDYNFFGSVIEFQPDPDEWHDPNGAPSVTYYIRATLSSGDTPTGGDVLNTVLALTSDRTWTWLQSSPGSKFGTLLIEIFSDSGGTNLLASGYYSGAATLDI